MNKIKIAYIITLTTFIISIIICIYCLFSKTEDASIPYIILGTSGLLTATLYTEDN